LFTLQSDHAFNGLSDWQEFRSWSTLGIVPDIYNVDSRRLDSFHLIAQTAGFGAVETLRAASPTAAAAMRRDGSTSVAPALLAGAGLTAGVAPESGSAVRRRISHGPHGRGDGALQRSMK
jgi:hypothetical protein